MTKIKLDFQKRIASFRHAIDGIGYLFRTQLHARIHALATCTIIIWGAYLGLSATEWCLLFICMAIVMSLEAVNTAIETLTDLVSPDYHILAKHAKDVAAGAVLISVIFLGVVWGIIFLPKIFPSF